LPCPHSPHVPTTTLLRRVIALSFLRVKKGDTTREICGCTPESEPRKRGATTLDTSACTRHTTLRRQHPASLRVYSKPRYTASTLADTDLDRGAHLDDERSVGPSSLEPQPADGTYPESMTASCGSVAARLVKPKSPLSYPTFAGNPRLWRPSATLRGPRPSGARRTEPRPRSVRSGSSITSFSILLCL